MQTNQTQGELLPCPFCGSAAFIFPNSSGLIGENWPRGKCYRCSSEGPVSNHLNDKADAVRKWNTRAQPTRDEEVAAVARAIDEALPESDKLTLAPSQIRRAARAALAAIQRPLQKGDE